MPAGKRFTIKAIISAIDHFSQPMRRISGGLQGNFGRALGNVGRQAGIVGGQLRGMLGPIGVIGGVASVVGVKHLVDSFSTGADEIAKFSRQIGLSTDAYQELKFVGERAGVSQSIFNTSMTAFSKRLGEARAGTGGLYTILKKLSPAFLEQILAAESNEKALNMMLTALGNVKDPATRAAVAAGAFSRTGIQMTRVAEQGAGEIARLRDRAQELGIVISEKATKNAEKFRDTMTNLEGAFTGVQNVIGTQLLPVLEPLLIQMGEFLVTNREIIGAKVSKFIESMALAISRVDFSEVLDGVVSLANFIGDTISFFGGIENAVIGFVLVLNGPLIASIASLLFSLGQLAVYVLTIPKVGAALAAVGTTLKALGVAALANPIGLFIGALVGAAALIIANWDTLGPYFDAALAGIVDIFSGAWESIGNLSSSILDGIFDRFDRLSSGLSAVGNFLGLGEEDGQASPRSGSSPLGASGRSALPNNPAQRVGGEINVRFENVPAGTRVERKNTGDAGVPLSTDVGSRALATQGLGG